MGDMYSMHLVHLVGTSPVWVLYLLRKTRDTVVLRVPQLSTDTLRPVFTSILFSCGFPCAPSATSVLVWFCQVPAAFEEFTKKQNQLHTKVPLLPHIWHLYVLCQLWQGSGKPLELRYYMCWVLWSVTVSGWHYISVIASLREVKGPQKEESGRAS